MGRPVRSSFFVLRSSFFVLRLLKTLGPSDGTHPFLLISQMAKIDRFEDLQCWQKARGLENIIYRVSTAGSFSKDYALKDQINRASGSVMDNIAEGFGRSGNKELINFLGISRASAFEVQSQLYRALDRKHIDADQFKELLEQTNQVISIISGFITYLKSSERKGPRYE